MSSLKDHNEGFATILDAICQVEGEHFFEATSSKNIGPPPEEDVDVFYNMVTTINKLHPYYAEQAKNFWFQAPDNSWFQTQYGDLKFKVKKSKISSLKLRKMSKMDKIGAPLKSHRVARDHSLFRSIAYLLFGKEKYYSLISEKIEAYKRMMEIKENDEEILNNGNLRALAKFFAINILIFFKKPLPRWKCYGPGELYFEKLEDLIEKEYKTGKYLEQKKDFPCLCLALKNKRFKAITSLSSK